MAEAPSSAPVVIDLTVSSPEKPSKTIPELPAVQDDDTAQTAPSPPKKSRRTRKKEAKMQEEESRQNMKRKSPDSASELPPNNRRRKSIDQVPQEKQQEDEQAPSNEDDLFFVDVDPLSIPPQPPAQPELEPEAKDENKLLLPAHVTVFGSTPVEIIAPTTSLEDDSIQFLDYDDAKVIISSRPFNPYNSHIFAGVCPIL